MAGPAPAPDLRFHPPLPPRKVLAIQRLGMGCLNKVALLFPQAFWNGCDMFGHVREDIGQRGEFFLW